MHILHKFSNLSSLKRKNEKEGRIVRNCSPLENDGKNGVFYHILFSYFKYLFCLSSEGSRRLVGIKIDIQFVSHDAASGIFNGIDNAVNPQFCT